MSTSTAARISREAGRSRTDRGGSPGDGARRLWRRQLPGRPGKARRGAGERGRSQRDRSRGESLAAGRAALQSTADRGLDSAAPRGRIRRDRRTDLRARSPAHRVDCAGCAAAPQRKSQPFWDSGALERVEGRAFTGPQALGARIELVDTIRPDALLFGESTGRVVIGTRDPRGADSRWRPSGAFRPMACRATGSRLVIGPPGGAAWIDAEVAALREHWRAAIPRRLEVT